MTKVKAVIISIVLFAFITVMSFIIICNYAKDKRDVAIEKAEYLITAQVSELDRALSSYIQATDTLRILIVDNQGSINDFNKVAKELYNDDNAFRSIQLAPDGNVKYVYPLEGNEEAFGDLFSDPDRKTEAEYARDSGETTLAGPFELYQSGLGIVVRQPIYIEEKSLKKFWGFAIVVLNVPEIFDSVHLNTLDSLDYNYQLWRIHPDTGEKQIILGASDGEMEAPVNSSFNVPGSTWTLSLSKKDGWVSGKELAAVIVGAVCISLLIPVLCYALLIINEQRKKMAEISYRDYLTELYNGRKMSKVLQNLYANSKSFYFIYLDVDKFKHVNDTFGHAAGDMLLKRIAERIVYTITPDDYAFRIGGDEFAILIPREVCIEHLIQKLKEEVSKVIIFGENIEYFPKVSVGYANYPKSAENIEKVLRIADEDMYNMKHINKVEN